MNPKIILCCFIIPWSACTISAPEPQKFTGNAINVGDDGEISLSDTVVQVGTPCAAGNVLTHDGTSWTCTSLDDAISGRLGDTVVQVAGPCAMGLVLTHDGNAWTCTRLDDAIIADDISVNNGLLHAPANGTSVVIGDGTDAPDPNAALEIRSESSGLLLPRLTSAQRAAITSPSAGLVVFDTDNAALMFYDGTSWVQMGAPQDKCPSGYVWDKTNTEIVLCTRGLDEVVKVGDLWVDRYENVVSARPDCSGTMYGQMNDDYPSSYPDNGQVSTSSAALYACSIRQVLPSRYITWFQAQQACAASGKHLISNAEWQLAASGTPDVDMTGDDMNPKCNTFWGNVRVTGSAGTRTSTSHCISLHGLEDMIGNADEWVSDWISAGLNWQTADGQMRQWPEAWGKTNSDGTRGINGRALGSNNDYSDGVPAAIRRGGGPDDGTFAGVFLYRADSGPFYTDWGLGFRCARR